MTLAALWSRSWTAPHCGHVHVRICSGSSSRRCPHPGVEQVLLDANHRDTVRTVRP
ncbi:putative transposase [Mycobacterium xenopi 3993]|nr:putative transposase [Mycobacterium xenopi 3993]